MVSPTLTKMSEQTVQVHQGSSPQTKVLALLKKSKVLVPFLKKHGGNLVGVVFIGIVGWLLWDTLAELDWQKTWTHTKNTPWETVAATVGLTMLSYLIYASFDLLELMRSKKTRPKLAAAMMAAWSCYSVNFNFGSILGGVGMRLKLYSDLQISKQRIGRIVMLSTMSNWLGYFFIAGLILIFTPHLLGDFPGLRHVPLRPLGLLFIAILAVVLILLKTKRTIKVRSFDFELPSFSEGLMRMGLGVLNWTVISAIYVGIFSNYKAEPVTVIVAGLVSAVAGVITHIPGGIGVLEATFLAAIGKQIGSSQVIAGLLFFRAVYYVLPLAIAFILLIILKTFPNLKSPSNRKVQES